MKIRSAHVEYQPDLQHPVEPIRLGVILEVGTGTRRDLILIGRQPKEPLPEFQLDTSWGPFRDIVTNWFDTVWRSLMTIAKDHPGTPSIVDALGTTWGTGNLYLTEPRSSQVAPTSNLLTVARRRYEKLVGENVRPFKGEHRRPRRVRSSPRESWVNYTLRAVG
jgi:hypothetical protein